MDRHDEARGPDERTPGVGHNSGADWSEGDLEVWRESQKAADTAFDEEAAEARRIGGDAGFVRFCNAAIARFLALGEANEALGLSFTREDVRRMLLDRFPRRTSFDLAEERAIRTASAYALGIRLSGSGAKDSPIEAAMFAAAYLEGLDIDSPDPTETVRKSIQRLRRAIRGTSVFRLNRDTLEVECFDAEERLLAGLPGKRGRPRKLPRSN